MKYVFVDSHGVDEAVAATDVGYFNGAVSVGAESSRHSLCSFRHFHCNEMIRPSVTTNLIYVAKKYKFNMHLHSKCTFSTRDIQNRLDVCISCLFV